MLWRNASPFATAAEAASAILQKVLCDLPRHDFATELWDGPLGLRAFQVLPLHLAHSEPRGTASVRSDRELALAESYRYGDFYVSGDLLAVFPVADYLMRREFTLAEKIRHDQKNWLATLSTERGDCIWRVRRIISAQESCTCIKPC